MKHRVAVISTLVFSTVMIDLGLWGVTIDAAYRMGYPNIQSIALALAVFLPFLIIPALYPALYKELRRAVALVIFAIAVFGLIYFIVMYGLQLVDIEMLGYTVGYIIAMINTLRIGINSFIEQSAFNK